MLNDSVKLKISVITVTYNAIEYIEEVVLNILQQSCPHAEHIVIDGQSDDGTVDVINKYKNCFSYHISEKDINLYDAMNKGISHAKGDYIIFVNASDFLCLGILNHVYDILRMEQPDILYGGLWYLKKDGSRIYRPGHANNLIDLVLNGAFNHPTCFVRKVLYDQIGGFNVSLDIAADYEFGIRAFKSGYSFKKLEMPISNFRYGGVSSSIYKNQLQRHKSRIYNDVPFLFSAIIFSSSLLKKYIFHALRVSIKKLQLTLPSRL